MCIKLGNELFLLYLNIFVCEILTDSSKVDRNTHRKMLIVSAKKSAQRASVDVKRNQPFQQGKTILHNCLCVHKVKRHRVV